MSKALIWIVIIIIAIVGVVLLLGSNDETSNNNQAEDDSGSRLTSETNEDLVEVPIDDNEDALDEIDEALELLN